MKTLLHPTTPVGHFVRHYLEMIVAMIVGMVALGPVWVVTGDAFGVSDALHRPEAAALVMATNMTIAMCGWMRYRGHGWRANVEMAAAMYLPFLLLFPPLWLGLISASGLMVGGHLVMLPAMAAAMLLRPDEYTGHHHRTEACS